MGFPKGFLKQPPTDEERAEIEDRKPMEQERVRERLRQAQDDAASREPWKMGPEMLRPALPEVTPISDQIDDILKKHRDEAAKAARARQEVEDQRWKERTALEDKRYRISLVLTGFVIAIGVAGLVLAATM